MTIESETADAPLPDETPTSDWRAALDSELRDHPALEAFSDVGALAREHVHLQKLIGRKGIVPPDADAGAEAYERFYDALGRPSDPTGYELDGIERPADLPWRPDIEEEMLARMHAAGLTNDQAKALFAAYTDLQGAAWREAQGDQARALERASGDLRTEWGDTFDARLDLANRAFAAAFGDDVDDVRQMRLADGSFLGDHPRMVRAFAAVGELLSEADFIGDAAHGGGLSREQARTELTELESDPAFRAALLDRAHPEHKQVLARRSQLAGAAYGAAPDTVADLRL